MAAVFEGRQPRWVDLRWLRSPGQVNGADPRLLECVAEFVAPLAGKSKDELIGDHIRQHRRTVRLVRAVFAAITSLLVIAAAGRITAYVQRNTAREQTLAAQSRQLVAQASSIQDSQPELARQLLVQAHRMSPTGQAQGALLASTSMARVIHTDGDSRAVSYSSRGAMVVTDDAVRLYDPATMAVLSTLPVPKKHATAAAFSPDGGLLAVGSRRGHTRLFDRADPRSPRLLGSLQVTTDSIEGLFFHPRSPLLLVDADTSGAALDIRDPARPRVTDSDFDGAMAISPDARVPVATPLPHHLQQPLEVLHPQSCERLHPQRLSPQHPTHTREMPWSRPSATRFRHRAAHNKASRPRHCSCGGRDALPRTSS